MDDFLVRVAGRAFACAAPILVLVTACAQATSDDSLNGSTLTDGGTAGGAGMPASGGGGNTSTSGGVPAGGTPSGGMPAAGMSGATTGGGGMNGGGGAGGTPSGGGGAGGTSGGGAGGTGGGGAGGTGGTGGTAGAGGAAPTGPRYVRFEATSEQAGAVWSSAAEIEVFTTGDVKLDRSSWQVATDSAETDDEDTPASAAIDGDTTTFWHTSWEPKPDDVDDAPLPHHLDIDLGGAHAVTGFSYLPRQTGTNGRVKDWKFYVSSDGLTWGTPVKTGTFPTGTALQIIDF